MQPTVFYRWQKEFFENGAAALRPNYSADQERIAYLERKIQTKDVVLAELMAELMAEHVALKKSAWGTLTGVWVPHDSAPRWSSGRRPHRRK